MKRELTTLLLIFSSIIIFSQTQTTNVVYYNSAIKKPSDTVLISQSDLFFKEAKAKYAIKDFEGSFSALNKAIEIDSTNLKAIYHRGLLSFNEKKDYKSAINDFSHGIRIKPEKAILYFMRGLSYSNLYNYMEARNNFSKAIQFDKDYLDAYFQRGFASTKLNERDSAIVDYDFIINYEGKNKETFKNLGITYNNKAYSFVVSGKYKEALPLVNKALDLDNKDAHIWDTRGEIYYNLQEYKKCIKDMDKAISIKELDNSYYIRGLANIKIGNKEEGCKNLTKASELGKKEAFEAIKTNCNK